MAGPLPSEVMVKPPGTSGSGESDEQTATARATADRATRRPLALIETAGADEEPSEDPSTPAMAVSIAGISVACSPEALADSAEAVRRTLS